MRKSIPHWPNVLFTGESDEDDGRGKTIPHGWIVPMLMAGQSFTSLPDPPIVSRYASFVLSLTTLSVSEILVSDSWSGCRLIPKPFIQVGTTKMDMDHNVNFTLLYLPSRSNHTLIGTSITRVGILFIDFPPQGL